VIILDTNVVSEGIRPKAHLAVKHWLDAQPPDTLYICAPVLAEIRFGIERLEDGVNRKRLLAAAERLQSETFANRILPFDAAAAVVYARVAAQRQARGKPISIMDCMIASIALAHGAAVATRDSYGFSDVGVTLLNPFEVIS
jgi:predicted nucleic acid-binding protein